MRVALVRQTGTAATRPPPVDDEERLIRADGRVAPGWRVVITSVLVMMVGPPPVLILSFGLFIPQLQSSFGWGVQGLAFGATLVSLMLVIVAPLQGYLVDRLGCRTLILVSMPVYGMGLLCMSQLGPAIGLYFLACAALPFAGLGLWPLTYMKVGASWFERRLGLALGCLNLGNGLGGALVPLLLGAVFGTLGWRAAFALLGLMNILVAWPMAALCIWERPVGVPAAGGTHRRSLPDTSVVTALRTSHFLILAAGFFVIGVLSGGFVLHQFNILTASGVTKRNATYLQAFLGVSSMAGRLVAGWLLDRVSAGRVLAGMLILIALVVGAYATSAAAVLTIPCVTGVGLLIGSEMNILGFVIRRYFAPGAFGKLYGLVFAIFASGGAAGAQILALSQAHLHAYRPGLQIISMLCLCAGVLFLGLGPYRYGPRSTQTAGH